MSGAANEWPSQGFLEGHVEEFNNRFAADQALAIAKKPRALNPTRFLCRSEVRKFLLEEATANRAHKFERVSEATLIDLNERVRIFMVALVKSLPSKGKTI